jgi:methylamine dehydrogenase heavy chain
MGAQARERRRSFASAMVRVLAAVAAFTGTAHAVLPAEVGGTRTTETLALPPPKHWVWVNDFVFPHMTDGAAHLIDGDTGRYLGMLSTGSSFSHVVLSRDGKLIYSPEIYFSRGTRGTRTDVVTIYDAATLKVVTEIEIPPKRASNVPSSGNAELTDDDRFLLVYNFNPAQSVTVVDTASRRFVGEIETPGCAFAFASGPRSFFSMCADASFLSVDLDEAGHAARQARSEPLFDVARDPLAERPVRVGNTWYYVSMEGWVHPIEKTATGFRALPAWAIASATERAAGWRPGGVQQLAIHAKSGRLYVIVHRGGRETHKDPGTTLWVHDLATHRRVKAITTPRPLVSIRLSSDDDPLLYGIVAESNVVDVLSPSSGRLLRSVKDVGTTPILLVTP